MLIEDIKPVVEESHGTKSWYLNGKLHRENGPAVESTNGDKLWYINGKLHRKHGPAVESANGDRYWFFHGALHREDGPAVQHPQEEAWYLNGKFLVKITNDQVILSKEFAENHGFMPKLNKLLGFQTTFLNKAKSIFNSVRVFFNDEINVIHF